MSVFVMISHFDQSSIVEYRIEKSKDLIKVFMECCQIHF